MDGWIYIQGPMFDRMHIFIVNAEGRILARSCVEEVI